MSAGKAASPKIFNRDVTGKVFHMEGRTVTINSAVCRILACDVDGKILIATTAASAVSSFDSQDDFAKSCLMIKTDASTGVAGLYENVGTAASSSFNLIGAVSAGEITLARGNLLVGNSSGVGAALDANDSGKILVGDGTDLASVAVSGDASLASNGALTVTDLTIASEARGDLLRRGASGWERVAAKTSGQIMIGDGTDVVSVAVSGDITISSAGAVAIGAGKVTPAMLSASQALTATADGLTTGLMAATGQHAIVTSANATDAITLPASAASLLGKQFTIWVGANGFELLTPAASGATINGTDADGTNQADIPANTLSRLTLVNTDTWLLENINSAGAVAAAIIPDND